MLFTRIEKVQKMVEDRKTPQLIPGTNPLADNFRREMETMMSRFFGGSSPFLPFETKAQRTGFPSLDMTGAISPAIDINETDTAIELTAELPGLSEDDVEIELKDRRLTLRGQKKVTHDQKGDLHISERSYGSFSRAMMLPDTVDIEKISAEFDKGILRVNMPKTEPKDPSRKIKVSSK
ncbi:Hsp20/alpha crystallin family protein [Marimonas sp. MJW-29]|uniref:Hsp20/alpha crystallin family protein n=1 Tax=Sulfitobacter sediminis TaxID=3234186 RepID=A0ABV3RUP8_9RHOB